MVSEGTRPPSIKDVALVAGVAHQTVSRVLNGFPSISDATRTRVLDAVEKVGYRPNIAARALVTNRSGVIGVLASNFTDYGPATAIAAIESASRDAGYRLSVTILSSSAAPQTRLAVDFLLGQAIDALVIVTPQTTMYEVLRTLDISVPVVVLEPTPSPHALSMACDQRLGARLATHHLVELGHREIVHISGPRDSIEAEVRMQGFIDEILAHDLQLRAPILGDWTSSSGHRTGLGLLGWRDFTAVFAANDQIALGFMHACSERGVRVPEDVSVVGFDDLPEAGFFNPTLTTVRQDFSEVGRRAVRMLLAEIAGGPVGDISLVAPHIVARGSTGPIPAYE